MTDTKKAIVIRGDGFTGVHKYAPEVKAKAYELFLTTSMDLMDIAIDLSLDTSVVARWAKKEKWLERKHEIELELFRGAEDKYRRLVVENRVPTLERHLRVSKELEEAIEDTLKDRKAAGTVSERTLTALARALSEATGVSARAAAISDTPFTDSSGNKEGKQPIILIGVGAQAPVTIKESEQKAEEQNGGHTVDAEFEQVP